MNAEELAEIINASGINILAYDTQNRILYDDIHPIVYVNGPCIQINFNGGYDEENKS